MRAGGGDQNGAEPTLGSTISSRTSRHDNAFDALRLIAALLVLLDHSFGLVGVALPSPLGGTDPGELALLMFFGMSGFLVTASWTSTPHLGVFARKRALRLMPALIVVVVLTALALGPLVTTLPVREYFASVQTYSYIAFNGLLLTWHQDLPGVFTNLGFHHDTPIYPVNGSLWTLPVEAFAYVVLALSAWLTRGLRAWYYAVPIVLGVVLVSPVVDIGTLFPVRGSTRFLTEIIELYVAFSVGSLLWAVRDRVATRPIYVVAAITALVAFQVGASWHNAAYAIAVPYLVLLAAFGLPEAFRGVGAKLGDLSYGVYITAYPIQQTIAQIWGPSLRPLEMLALSAPLSLGAAKLSWHFIESPALARKVRRPRGERVTSSVVPGGLARAESEPVRPDVSV